MCDADCGQCRRSIFPSGLTTHFSLIYNFTLCFSLSACLSLYEYKPPHNMKLQLSLLPKRPVCRQFNDTDINPNADIYPPLLDNIICNRIILSVCLLLRLTDIFSSFGVFGIKLLRGQCFTQKLSRRMSDALDFLCAQSLQNSLQQIFSFEWCKPLTLSLCVCGWFSPHMNSVMYCKWKIILLKGEGAVCLCVGV